jgi:DNA-binding transcriptional LysR family regulator
MKKSFTMSPETLAALPVFLRVARLGSFRAAADQLEVSPSAVSQNLRALETRLGVRLLNRTTRRVGRTEAGERLQAQAAPAIAALADALEQVEADRDRPAGLLRINLARGVWPTVAERLPGFNARYPEVQVELFADDGLSDLVAGGFDAGIRLGECLSRDMVALPVTPPLRMAVVGSPGYFERHPPPRVPADLAAHQCIHFRFTSSGRLVPWEFLRDGQEYSVEVGGRLILNDGAMAREAALRGLGLAQLFESNVADDIAAGRLLRVLEPHYVSFPGFYIYYPARRQLPPKLRAFVDCLREPLRDHGPQAALA